MLNLKGSGLTYTPGDSLGRVRAQFPGVVDELIASLDFNPDAIVKDPKGQSTPLRKTLLQDYTVNRANRKIMSALAQGVGQGEPRNRFMEIVDNNEPLRAIRIPVITWTFSKNSRRSLRIPRGILAQLTPVVPRLYSIASSLDAHPGRGPPLRRGGAL